MNTDKDKKEVNYFEEGQLACKHYFASQAYAGLTRYVTAELAIKIFMGPVKESLVQVAMPLPRYRQKWLAGFKKELAKIRAEERDTD